MTDNFVITIMAEGKQSLSNRFSVWGPQKGSLGMQSIPETHDGGGKWETSSAGSGEFGRNAMPIRAMVGSGDTKFEDDDSGRVGRGERSWPTPKEGVFSGVRPEKGINGQGFEDEVQSGLSSAAGMSGLRGHGPGSKGKVDMYSGGRMTPVLAGGLVEDGPRNDVTKEEFKGNVNDREFSVGDVLDEGLQKVAGWKSVAKELNASQVRDLRERLVHYKSMALICEILLAFTAK